MKKIHDLKRIVVDCVEILYFYQREKCDIYGNPRFRVFIIDPDGPAVYETILKTYEGLIADHVKAFVEEAIEQ